MAERLGQPHARDSSRTSSVVRDQRFCEINSLKAGHRSQALGDEMMDAIPSLPTSYEELLAHQNGQSLDAYRREQASRAATNEESKQYLNQPQAQWPELFFNWDTSRAGQRHSLDGVSPNVFDLIYPDGLVLGWVKLEEFDPVLCRFSRRDGAEELWSLGTPSRLAHLIAYLAHGRPISPPLVKARKEADLILQGGHHRYAIIKAKGVQHFPVHVEPKNVNGVSQVLSVRWNDC